MRVDRRCVSPSLHVHYGGTSERVRAAWIFSSYRDGPSESAPLPSFIVENSPERGIAAIPSNRRDEFANSIAQTFPEGGGVQQSRSESFATMWPHRVTKRGRRTPGSGFG